MDIVSATQTTIEQAQAWARSKGATEIFVALAAFYWEFAGERSINPEGAYCQAAHETGFGKFGGTDPVFSATADMHNLCGLKTKDASATAKFSSWEEGIVAHVDHLALYAGRTGYPKADSPDPRQFPSIAGIANTFVKLGGHWAPDTLYGQHIEELMQEIYAFKNAEAKLKEIGLIINS